MKFRHRENLPSLAHLNENSSNNDYTASTQAKTPLDTRPVQHIESSACLCDDNKEESTESHKAKPAALAPHERRKKVLVTGGAGFVGSNVAEALLARGDSVVIVDKMKMNDYYDVLIKEGNLRRLIQLTAQYDAELTIYKGDICDEGFMLDLFEKERPKWICHMAARAGVRPSIQDPYVYIHSNIGGTTHLMELAHEFGVEVCVVLLFESFCSSITPAGTHCSHSSTPPHDTLYRTLYSHPRAASTADPKTPSSPRKKTLTIPSPPTLPPKRPANYWPTPTIISTISTSQACDSSPSMDRGAGPTWLPSNSLIASVGDWNCSSSETDRLPEITPTFPISLTVFYAPSIDPTPIKCLTLERDPEPV